MTSRENIKLQLKGNRFSSLSSLLKDRRTEMYSHVRPSIEGELLTTYPRWLETVGE